MAEDRSEVLAVPISEYLDSDDVKIGGKGSSIGSLNFLSMT